MTTLSTRVTEKRKRRDQFVRQTVTHAEADLLLAEGWQLDRKMQHRSRVKREKSLDEDLENRMWCLLADFGFPELNQGRQFKIWFRRNNKIEGSKQVDIFAKDDETVIVAECKASAEIRKKSLQKDIEEFANLKGKMSELIKQHYGSEFKPKIIWAIISDKIIWSKEDKNRAAGENIAVITERELRYFAELAKHLGPAGRYQFLAHFLQDQKVPGLEDRRVPALRGKLGKNTFYTFVTTPERLLKIAFVNHRTLNDPKGMPTYQRLITKGRIKQIQNFLQGGGYFPTNIIVNFVAKPKFEIRLKEEEADVHYGTLYLPEKYKSAWVIDGQHRLYGYSRLHELQRSQNIVVLAFQQMSKEDEANLFVTINHEQKTVPRTLLDDLQGELKWGSDDPRERITAMCSRLVNVLNAEAGGPFHLRVVQTGLRSTRETCLTLPALLEALKKSELLGRVGKKTKLYESGPFTGKDDYSTLDRARHGLEDIFSILKEANPEIWRAGADGAVWTNTGFAAILMIIAEAIRNYEKTSGLDCNELSPEEIAEQVQDIMAPVTHRLKSGTAGQIVKLFKEGVPYGSTGPRELYLKLVGVIREQHRKFGPVDFDQWRNEQNLERKKQATEKVQELNAAICATIFSIFRREYGDEHYFSKGVTSKDMRTAAYSKQQDDDIGQQGPLEEYLNLIDYKKIVEKSEHWPLFQDVFSIKLDEDKAGQAKYLHWMDKLNDIRKKTVHQAAGRVVTDAEADFVDWIHQVFLERLANSKHLGVTKAA
ncbi:DGQHR domain-containing protein [Aestuariivirga sp.]|uniref:DGQHR domain-containing protein n=1 Tax=Aestuariivirga sp. TaxID=2650926 RepID=UPI0039E594F5